MSSNKVPLDGVLSPDECRIIDAYSSENQGKDILPGIAEFIRMNFSVKIDVDPDIINSYKTDSSNLPGNASVLARPSNERECAIILRMCRSCRIPVTLSAGRSNLTGSATPTEGMIVSLSEMKIPGIRVDPIMKTALSPVGIIFEDMRKSVLEQSEGKLFFPVDPTSRFDAMVGGAIACNASGFTPGEAGAMRSWVRSLRFLLMNGMGITAVRGQYISEDGMFLFTHGSEEIAVPVPRYSRPSIKNASGPYSNPHGSVDLVDLIIGSEGIFALVTECTLALSDHPREYLDLFLSLPDESDALNLLFYLSGGLPEEFSSLSAFEYFGPNCRRYMDHEHRLFRTDHAVGVYLQIPLRDEPLEQSAVEWLEILQDAPCRIQEDAIMILLTDRDRTIFFEARHSLPARSLEVVTRRGTHTIMTDTVVPPRRFAEFLEYTHALIRSEGLDYLVFGHLGDCHLHFMILPEKDQMRRGVDVYDRIIEKSSALGGVYSGEHGTGKRKRGDFLKCYGAQAAEQVLATKRAFDPLLLLNRGNVIAYP
jgi:D-lactate dehydrogenase (cytochrome)